MNQFFSFYLIIIFPIVIACETQEIERPNPREPYEKVKFLKTKALNTEAFKFCIENDFDTNFCFMIDMNLHSGKSRFFVWDLNNEKALDSGLVSHGTCEASYIDSIQDDSKFSNIPNSHCSSLGKYKVGDRAYSNWGINVKYWIHGIEETNSNAVKRVVVLHSWSLVPDDETHPSGSTESWGCPAVSNNFMRRLDKILQRTDKPVLLWIFR
jgi:hypothetical protein